MLGARQAGQTTIPLLGGCFGSHSILRVNEWDEVGGTEVVAMWDRSSLAGMLIGPGILMTLRLFVVVVNALAFMRKFGCTSGIVHNGASLSEYIDTSS